MASGDREFVQGCLQGDRDAFGELVRRYEHAAFGLALSYVRDFAVAEDLAQEAFISAYLNLPQLQDPTRFGPWLRTIVRNMCRTWQRSQKAETISLDEIGEDAVNLRQDNASPDQIYESKDLRMRILEAIEQLSEKNRQAVTLYYIDGLSVEEIGAFLEVSSKTINQRLYRAREQLKEEMITMVEDTLKSSHPKEFPEKVLQEISDRAQQAHRQHSHLEAVKYYDEALGILDELEETQQQKRWKADMLWGRGESSNFLKWNNKQEVVTYQEAALKLEGELGDQKKYAECLLRLGWAYGKTKEAGKDLQAFQKAASIFEAIGDKAGQAKCLYWIGTRHIPWLRAGKEKPEPDFARSLESFRSAAELAHQTGDAQYEALSLPALRVLEETGEDPDGDTTASIGATCFNIERSSDALILKAQPGFCLSKRKKTERSPQAALTYMDYPTEWLRFPLEVGRQRSYPSFAYGTEEMQATAIVERLDASVEVPAGAFQNCLELVTEFVRKGEDPSESYRRLNLQNSGTRRAWFAPGVGLVRLTYHHGDGVETEALLTDYQAPGNSEDYFPLQVETRWHYRVTNTCSAYAVRDTCWVATQDGNMSYISQFHYSKKI